MKKVITTWTATVNNHEVKFTVEHDHILTKAEKDERVRYIVELENKAIRIKQKKAGVAISAHVLSVPQHMVFDIMDLSISHASNSPAYRVVTGSAS